MIFGFSEIFEDFLLIGRILKWFEGFSIDFYEI